MCWSPIPSSAFNTVKDLVAYAKSKGGKISIGHSGPGTMGHLCTVLFASEAGLDVTSVSYRGTAPMMIDVLGGQIDAGFPAYNPATRQAKDAGGDQRRNGSNSCPMCRP